MECKQILSQTTRKKILANGKKILNKISHSLTKFLSVQMRRALLWSQQETNTMKLTVPKPQDILEEFRVYPKQGSKAGWNHHVNYFLPNVSNFIMVFIKRVKVNSQVYLLIHRKEAQLTDVWRLVCCHTRWSAIQQP